MRKYDTYEQLAAETLGELTASKNNWLSFLDTASRMYKYNFDEQLMIHAQRPDAKACASFAFWTDEQRMNRHVKRGAKGIALLDRESHRLYYVYDAADTEARENQQSKDPEDYIWKIKTGTASDVNALLAQNTGVKSGNLQKTIIMMADAAVRSKITAYSHEFNMLYQKDADRIADPAMVQAFMETVTESVAVMALKRSGFDADAVITDQTFAHLGKFSAEYSALIGRCTCDIAADVIREVERAVKMQQQMERSNAHETLPRAAAAEENGGERDRVHSGRENTDVHPELRGGRTGTDRQIRTDEGAVSEGISESSLLADAPAEHVDSTSDRDGRAGTQADRQHRTGDGRSGWNGRNSKDDGSDGMGRQNEQLSSSSRGNRAEGTDLRINSENAAKGAPSAVSVSSSAEGIHAAFAELSLNHSFSAAQQLYLDRLEKFAVKNDVSENLVDTAFALSPRFRDVYGNRRNLNRSRFVGQLDEVEKELESAIARHLSEPMQPLTEEEFIIYMVDVIQDDRTVRNAHQNSDHQNFVLDVHAAIDRIAAELAASYREIEGHTQAEIVAFLNVYHADAEQQKNVKQVITNSIDSNLNMLEETRKTAQEQGIPFSDKIRNGADDELDPLVYDGSMSIEDFQIMQEQLIEQKSEILSFSIGFSEHPAFPNEKTEMSFAAGNKLLGMLDEKQHSEREIKECGWYHKTDFEINCILNGEELTYTGRYDLGDGEGSLIQHIKNHLDFCEKNYGKFGEETQSREDMAENNRLFLDLLRTNATLTAEDEQVIAEIMTNEDQWFALNTPEEPDFLDEIDAVEQVAADVQRIQEQEEEVQLTLDAAEPVQSNEASPEPEQNFTITDDALGEGGAKTKFHANVTAIETLKAIEAEGRTATPEEQEVLSHYVGWGGLPQAFDENNDKWTKEYAALRDLLTPEEYASAKGSVLNSAEIVEIPQGLKNFSYAEIDSRLYFRSGSEMQSFKGSKADEVRIKGMVKIRDALRTLIEMQMQEGFSDAEIQAQQQELGSVYDAFTAKHGILNSKENQKAFREDSALPLLCSLEQMQGDKCIGKAPIFEKRTINPKIEITSVGTAAEALAVSISEKACVDMEYMQQLTGFASEKIKDDLRGVIFENPMRLDAAGNPRLETADEYLSGNIRKKLDYMQEHHANDPVYVHNIEALTVAMPKPLQASDIDIRLGATWIDPKLVQQFMYETLKTPVFFRDVNGMNLNRVKVEYSPVTSEWNIVNKSLDKRNLLAETQFGTKRKNAYELIEDCLNLRDTRVNDRVIRDGKEVYVINQRETELAQDKQRELQNAFKEWIFRDPARREQVVNQYNVLFNSTRPREYDGSHLVFEGMNAEIQLRPHQKNAVAHALYGGNTLFAHEVGAGKTYEMIAAAMEGKRLELHSKALICVPNHLTEQMGSDFIKLYPNANLLVATADDFSKDKRKKLFAKIATGDYDAIIIGHSQLIKLPISNERQEQLLNTQINEIIRGINELKAKGGESFLVKQMEKSRKSLETKLKKLTDAPARDDVVNFEELGIDKLILDEAHLFKNLFISTKMRNISGISTNDSVQKTFDLLLKCQYLDEITGGKGLIFATGTPVSNSISEIYSMMVYLQSDLLEETGLKHFDAWAANFAETVTDSQLSPEGNGYQMKTRFAKFNNLPELMALFKECADVKTADMLNLPTPECTMTTVVAKPTEVQKDLIFNLGERAKRIRLRQVSPKDDNFPMITNDGRKIGLDQRLMNLDLPDEPQSKVNLCVENVFKIWSDTAEQRSTQLIFSDLGVPQNAADKKKHGERFSVYDDIKKKLIDRGVPPEEIAFIHDAATKEAKDKLFAKVRKGEIRVLIGSTSKMGAGTNVQDKLIASHDLDAPWKPSDMEQRRGRMVRQGNENPHVQLFRYVTEGTFDAYLYQMLENKQRFISQIMTSKSPVRSCQDVDDVALSFAEIKALSAGNLMIKEKMDLDVEVAKLKILKANHQNVQYQLEDEVLKSLPANIAGIKARIEGLETDIASYAALPVRTDEKGNTVFPSMEIGGKVYTDKEEAGAALLEALRSTALHDSSNFSPIASYQGFAISAKFDALCKCYIGEIKGAATRQVEFGSSEIGNITRIDNALAGMEKDLTAATINLENVMQQLENAKSQLGQPFPREEELRQKEARLAELTKALEITDEVRITDPFIIEVKSEQQLDSLKNSGIPFEHSKTEDGRLLVKVNKDDKDTALKAITSGPAGLKL